MAAKLLSKRGQISFILRQLRSAATKRRHTLLVLRVLTTDSVRQQQFSSVTHASRFAMHEGRFASLNDPDGAGIALLPEK